MRVTVPLLLLLAILSGAAAAEPPQRVVSVGGSLTEIVYALGQEGRLVAVDSTSSYPPAAGDLPDVGYMRQLAAEPILALAPDLLLLVEDAGPPATIDQLRAAGVRIETVPDEPSLAGVREKVTRVADALGVPREGGKLLAEIEAAQQAVAERLAEIGERPRVLFLLSVGSGAPLASGLETSAAGIVELAGGANALEGFTGYKPLSPEAAVAAQPDVVLVTESTLERLGGAAAVLARPELAATPAAAASRIVAMDALLLLGFGPRTPQAVALLAEALHPSLSPGRE
jgi:iron complex transport system substrate-binding protein